MNTWKKISENLLLEKEKLYIQLNMEDTANADYAHAKKVCIDFKIKNLVEYRAMYVQSHTSLLSGVIQNFQNVCLQI